MNTKNPDPYLFFKYNRGVGDLVASILHSKAFGWLTKRITGKDKPCTICSKRADALNTLFPIPFWRLFFKDVAIMTESLSDDLRRAGYQTSMTSNRSEISSMKTEFIPEEGNNNKSVNFNPLNDIFNDEKLAKYFFISSSDQEVDHLLIRTQYFKLKP